MGIDNLEQGMGVGYKIISGGLLSPCLHITNNPLDDELPPEAE